MNHSTNNPNVIPTRCSFSKGDLIGSKYQMISELGSGTFGQVIKVNDSEGRFFALKLLRLWEVSSDIRQALTERFEMEYRTGQIQSPNLVQSCDYGYLNGNPYIVMEFCDGGDISRLAGSRDVDFCRIANDILSGLDALHRNGKVHRDLKLENVLLRGDGTAVLTDFGITGDKNNRMTHMNMLGRPDQVFGTYAYMPPEQEKRERGGVTVLPTTDIFSFGVVMYQLLTGSFPYGKLEDQNDLAMYRKRANSGDWDREKLLAVTGGSEWVSLIDGCLKPSWKERIQSASEAMRLIPQKQNVEVNEPASAVNMEQHRAGESVSVTVIYGPQFGQKFDLKEIEARLCRRLITLGRGPVNNIELKDYKETYTSRRHATIEDTGDGQWVIRDGQWLEDTKSWYPSSNGTFLNTVEVDQEGALMKLGDIITLGNIKLKFE